jgi:hypothetical protein
VDDAVVILGIFIICNNRIQTMEEEDAQNRSIIQDKNV